MPRGWEDMAREGWEKEEKGGKICYKTPLRGGKRLRVNQARDIPDEFLGDRAILYPRAKKVKDPKEKIQEGEHQQMEVERQEKEVESQKMNETVERQEDQGECQVEMDQGRHQIGEGGDHTYGKRSGGGEQEEEKDEGSGCGVSEFLLSLQRAAGRLLADPAGHFDHKAELKATAAMLHARARAARQGQKQLDVAKIQEDLMIAMKAADNPFLLFPLKTDTNIYSDIVKFAAKHSPDILNMIVMLTHTHEASIDGDTVIQAAFIFAQMACAINPSVNSGYYKMISVFLKTCGLTDTGLLALSKLGVCAAPRTLLDTKDKLAALDEVMVKEQAAYGLFHVLFDNLNFKIHRTQFDYTLPVLLFETVPTYQHSTLDGLAHDDKLELFTPELLYMNAPINAKYKEAVELVVCTVLAGLASTIPGLEWLQKVLPRHHNHVFKDSASNRSMIHTEPVICLNEMDLNNMIDILSRLQDRYLDLLCERLVEEEKAQYRAALAKMREAKMQEAELRGAEAVVWAAATTHGFLLIHGDQLSVRHALLAIKAKSDGYTKIDSLAFIELLRLGDFHTLMAQTVKHVEALMPDMTSKDPLSLAALAIITFRSHKISNKEKDIKKCGAYEEHENFFLSIGKEFIVDGLKTFLVEQQVEGVRIDESKAGALDILKKFLWTKRVDMWYDPDRPAAVYHDGLQGYLANLSARCLLTLAFKHAVKEGDALCIHGLHRILTVFFQYSHNNNMSQYGPSLLNQIVDYESASSRTKQRVDLIISCNLTGELGRNKPLDMVVENEVMGIKDLFTNMHHDLEVTVVEKAVKAYNPIKIIKNHHLDCLQMSDHRGGGGSSEKYLKEADKEDIREELQQVAGWSSDSSREKVEYTASMLAMWDRVTVSNLKKFINNKKRLYDLERASFFD